jgi:RimJ/RimL family protein N-acetyltransferase
LPVSTDLTPFGDPIGEPVPGWTPRSRPQREPVEGGSVRLEPLSARRHADDLFAAYAADRDGRMWTYMPNGPFASPGDYRSWAENAEASDDPLHFAAVDRATGKALGTASYLRIEQAVGVIEVGWIAWSPAMQQSRHSTEAMFLMMSHVFDDLGYRRYEWKCNALNAPSRRTAERLGFTFEGVFRQATIVKGRNRDTAWYSIIDSEWPAAKSAFTAWLDPGNFDPDGRQKRRLEDFRTVA